MPISIRMPIIAGSDSASPLSSSRPSAPPTDSGRAAMMVSGCAKSWNSSTSTQYTSSTPATMAIANSPNSSFMRSESP